jgi:hypothetical protein
MHALLLVVRDLLTQNIARNSDQPIVYVYRLFNNVEYNYSTIERKALAMNFCIVEIEVLFIGK